MQEYDYSGEYIEYSDPPYVTYSNPQSPQSPQSTVLNDNNGWNESIEHDAKIIAEKSGGLRWMHNQSSSVFLKRYWIVTGINILLSAIVVAFNSVTGAECIVNNMDPYKIVSIVGGALLGVTTTYSGLKNYGSRVTAHQVIEGNYQALFYTIKNQLNLNRKERQFGKDFLEWVQKEYTDLSTNPDSPNIPGFVEEKYKKLIDGSGIASYSDPIETVNIKRESPVRKQSDIHMVYPPQSSLRPRSRRRMSRRKPSSSRSRSHSRIPVDDDNDDDNFTVSIPNTTLSARDKWQLSRFYGNK
jgi:hypothetical protein